jgi:hypothetical protein
MALTEETIVGQITVDEESHVSVRTDTVIKRDGEEVSRTFHRSIISPGMNYSDQPQEVKDICDLRHTAEVITAYEAKIAAQRNAV